MLYLYDSKWDRNNCITLRAIKEIKYGVFDDLIRSDGEREFIISLCLWLGYEWTVTPFTGLRYVVRKHVLVEGVK